MNKKDHKTLEDVSAHLISVDERLQSLESQHGVLAEHIVRDEHNYGVILQALRVIGNAVGVENALKGLVITLEQSSPPPVRQSLRASKTTAPPSKRKP